MPKTDSTGIPVKIMESLGIPELVKINLLIIYKGSPLPKDKKSVSYKIYLRNPMGTLSGERLAEIMAFVIEELNQKGYSLR